MSSPEVPVKITVRTTIDGQETFELTVFGRYFQKGSADFLQYEEEIEEGTVRTIVKMAGEEALILRGGALKMRLPFELNRKLNGSYELPFGQFTTETKARRLEYSAGFFDIVYDFWMDGAPAGTYHLEIAFQEEEK
nr:DUF1934 domain-containing protein [Neobacillus sp. Marseille-Q6967]